MPYGDQYGLVKRPRMSGVPAKYVKARARTLSVVPIPRSIRRASPGELKFLDTAFGAAVPAVAAVPAGGQINLIPQNVTESGRVGRKCVIKEIQFNGFAQFAPAASATASDVMTWYLVLDKQCNGAAAAVLDVFTSTTLPNALRNLDNERRFRILKKVEITFNPGAGVTTAYNTAIRTMNYRLKCNIPLEFDPSAATGALTTIRSNNVFLINGAATSGLITAFGTHRVLFLDS